MPLTMEISIDGEKVRQYLINVSLPLRNVRKLAGWHSSIVPSRVNEANKRAIDLKNAKDVAIFDDALRKANAMVPHGTLFFDPREPVEGVEFHGL